MPIKYMKQRSTLLAIKEMKIKTTLRFHLIPVILAIIEKTTRNAGRDMGEKELFIHCWWEYKLVQPVTSLEINMEAPQNIKNKSTLSPHTTFGNISEGV
jgi:hypothetical protein